MLDKMLMNMLPPMLDNLLAKYGIAREDVAPLVEEFKTKAFQTLEFVQVTAKAMEARLATLEAGQLAMLNALKELHADMLARQKVENVELETAFRTLPMVRDDTSNLNGSGEHA